MAIEFAGSAGRSVPGGAASTHPYSDPGPAYARGRDRDDHPVAHPVPYSHCRADANYGSHADPNGYAEPHTDPAPTHAYAATPFPGSARTGGYGDHLRPTDDGRFRIHAALVNC